MRNRFFSFLLMTALLLSLFPTTTSVAAAASDFLIDNGVLIKYSGTAANIVIPKGVTTISEYAFLTTKKDKVTSITMPDSVTTIESGAFVRFKSLTKLTLSKGLKSIGEAAFSGCAKIKAIQLPYGLERIEYAAFQDCKLLVNMPIPATVKYIGHDSVYSWPKNQEFVILGDGILYKYNGKGGNVVVPNNVKIIGERAFSEGLNDVDIKNVTIPGSVREIWDNAFYTCTNLTSVKLGEGIKSISPSAFGQCTKLTKINIPKSLDDTSLVSFRAKVQLDKQYDKFDVRGNGVLYKYNGTDASVIIPAGVKSIGVDAFRENRTLEKVVIPEGVLSIGAGAFSGCSFLEQVDLPDSVNSIGEYAFGDCNHLLAIQLPRGVIRIEDKTFTACISLEKFKIPDTVISIGKDAFSYCSALGEVLIPKSVTSIGKYAFLACSRLDGVILPSSVTYIGNQAFGSGSMTSITIQNGNARVDENAFLNFDYNKIFIVTVTAPAGGAVQRMAIRNKKPFKAYTKQMESPTEFLKVKCTPDKCKVLVNGVQKNIEKYIIDSNLYCNAKDMATALTGTNKQFSVSRDTEHNTVRLTSVKPITKTGVEQGTIGMHIDYAVKNTSEIYKDGNKVTISAYIIDENIYMELFDLMKCLDTGFMWDETTAEYRIDTSAVYAY